MSQVDYVLMGAEGVVESGGIVNKIGCYTVSLCARDELHQSDSITAKAAFPRSCKSIVQLVAFHFERHVQLAGWAGLGRFFARRVSCTMDLYDCGNATLLLTIHLSEILTHY
jgi:hypothetical protein